jgi:putative phosphoesterase
LIIGVFADTHGDLRRIDDCMALLEGSSLLLHAGDLFEDGIRIAKKTGLKVIGVTGNCDYLVKGPVEEMVTIGTKRIYITHGHIYKVKQDYNYLIERAKALGVDVAVFGHTHVPTIFQEDGILFVNPGSIYSPRRGSKPSCARIEVARRGTSARVLVLDK